MLARVLLEQRMHKRHALGFKRESPVCNRVDWFDAARAIRNEADRSGRGDSGHRGVATRLLGPPLARPPFPALVDFLGKPSRERPSLLCQLYGSSECPARDKTHYLFTESDGIIRVIRYAKQHQQICPAHQTEPNLPIHSGY